MAFGKMVAGDEFDDFLPSHVNDVSLDNRRFIARNFLLDENVALERRNSYEAAGAKKRHVNMFEWEAIHENYLLSRVFLDRPLELFKQIDRNNARTCPETFRHQNAFRNFGAADVTLELVRVEQAERIAQWARFSSVEEVLDLAQEVLKKPFSDDQQNRLNTVLDISDQFRDLRPVWAVFWDDVRDLFGTDSSNDPVNWPDELRDRLGLYHFNPASRPGEKIHIMVFRYPINVLPYLVGQPDLFPIGVPTVLDSWFSEAFCPVPAGQLYGHMVDLGQNPYQSQRVLVHPFIKLRAGYLFRVGAITRPLLVDLADVRKAHLQWLREHTGRRDYATMTDGDLS